MQKQQNPFQVAVGFIVLVVATLFVTHIYKIRTLGEASFGQSMYLKAKFSSIDGIATGSDVKMSGIKIGTVKAIDLDTEDYNASVTIVVRKSIKIPNDSILGVATSGLLGSKFLDVKPGGSDDFMSDGGVFMSTASSLNLENLISKFAGNIGSDKK